MGVSVIKEYKKSKLQKGTVHGCMKLVTPN